MKIIYIANLAYACVSMSKLTYRLRTIFDLISIQYLPLLEDPINIQETETWSQNVHVHIDNALLFYAGYCYII